MDSNIKIDADEGLTTDLELTTETNAEVDALADAEADVQIEAETEEGNPDPWDPNLADVDKIMKRYENSDIKKELDSKKMCLG